MKTKDDSEVGTPALQALLTSSEVAKILRVDRSTLSRWRSQGNGPRVIWLGTGCPRYRHSDVLAWLDGIAS